jgi:Fur family ferric uptake transcriptional regulator
MCQQCNYPELLRLRGLDPTPHRLRIMEVIGNNASPIGAQEIFRMVGKIVNINRVTVYRILELLVENHLVERLSGRGRSLLYGMAPCEHHPAHPHFHCRNCGAMLCLQPLNLNVDMKEVQCSFPGEIREVEIRIHGVCQNCLPTE